MELFVVVLGKYLFFKSKTFHRNVLVLMNLLLRSFLTPRMEFLKRKRNTSEYPEDYGSHLGCVESQDKVPDLPQGLEPGSPISEVHAIFTRLQAILVAAYVLSHILVNNFERSWFHPPLE